MAVARTLQMPMTGFPVRRLLRTKQAAEYLGMKSDQVEELVNNGELRVVQRKEHSPWLFDIYDLDDWIERKKI